MSARTTTRICYQEANRSLREAAQLDDRHVNAGEFGVVANLLEPDTVFRSGAKVWLCGGENGDGFESRIFYGLAKGTQRSVEKWAPTIRFHNFRCAWVPEQLRPYIRFCRGSRVQVEGWANEMHTLTRERRAFRADREAEPSAGASKPDSSMTGERRDTCDGTDQRSRLKFGRYAASV